MRSRDERRAKRAAEGEHLLALAHAYGQMSAVRRLDQAQRVDLTEDEQLALAVYADDADVARALLSNPTLSDTAHFVANARNRKNRPWWQRLLSR
jgi:hypothetical protein